jgi:hypothetical protein
MKTRLGAYPSGAFTIKVSFLIFGKFFWNFLRQDRSKALSFLLNLRKNYRNLRKNYRNLRKNYRNLRKNYRNLRKNDRNLRPKSFIRMTPGWMIFLSVSDKSIWVIQFYSLHHIRLGCVGAKLLPISLTFYEFSMVRFLASSAVKVWLQYFLFQDWKKNADRLRD